jgi:serine/threonine protein kinase
MSTMPLVGDELAGYRLISVLGRGGMSVVYQAEHPRLSSMVAVKVLAPELATNDVFRARFLQESRIAASLNHPNVIPIFDMGPHDDLLYIAMRYVAGSDLRTILNNQGRLSPTQAVFVIGQTGRALDLAHRHSLVHRDVKPGNVLVESGADEDDPDHVYLADFGITKHALSRTGLTPTGQFMGTIDYVAPEQIQGKTVDSRADIYSLGCVLYETLTGQVPFVKDIDAAVLWAHVEESAPRPSTVVPGLPSTIDDVIERALAKDPADRFPTCRELTAAARAAFDDPDLGGVTIVSRARSGGHSKGLAPTTSPAGRRDGESPRAPSGPPSGSRPDSDAVSAPVPGSGPRPARTRTLVGALFGVLLLLAGGGVWFGLHNRSQASPPPDASSVGRRGAGPSASGSPSMGPSDSMSDGPSASPGTLMSVLGIANRSTGDWLPPRTCRQSSQNHVVCSSPHFGVTTADFRTFGSLDALYAAYTAQVKELSGGRMTTNGHDCNATSPSGEGAWNHDHHHVFRFSLAQVRGGMLDEDTEAAGRFFCRSINGAEVIVWTQNSGRLLAVIDGAGFPHAETYKWWHRVHHAIALIAPGMDMTQ